MNIKDLAGWKDVFDFSLRQQLKVKSTKYLIIISMIVVLLYSPISAFLSKDSGKSSVEKIYFFNETNHSDIDFSEVLLSDESTKDISIEECSNSYEEQLDIIEKEEKTAIVCKISDNNTTYALNFVKASSDKVEINDIEKISGMFVKYFNSYKTSLIKTDQQVLNNISVPLIKDIKTVGDDSSSDESDIESEHKKSNEEIVLTNNAKIVMMIVVNFLILISGTFVSGNTAIEKTNKVFENILISIKPLGLLVGKILAMVFLSISWLVAMIMGLFVSVKFTNKFIAPTTDEIIKIFSQFSVVSIILVVVFILLGSLFYNNIVGMCAATVKKIDELEQAISMYNTIFLVSFFVTYFYIIILGTEYLDTLGKVLVVLPVTSPMVVPCILLSSISISKTLIVISICCLIVSSLLLLAFSSKIYMQLIRYNGNKITIRQLLKLSKGGIKKDV